MRIDLVDTSYSPALRLIPDRFTLYHSNWNDWWEYETLFFVSYVDPAGSVTEIGAVKIAGTPEKMEETRPHLPESFEFLDSGFYSLGQDESYYSHLMGLPDGLGTYFLSAMNDVVADDLLLTRHLHDTPMNNSLLRHVSLSSVKGQFRRIVFGGEIVESFDVSYIEPPDDDSEGISMRFAVKPSSMPPTNVHVLIGRNGSGKSRLLMRMANSLIQGAGSDGEHFTSADGANINESIAGVGSVTFSAFDTAEPLDESQSFKAFNVGLKKRIDTADGSQVALKSHQELLDDMGKALFLCSQKSLARWLAAVETLESDPIFESMRVQEFVTGLTSDGLSKDASEIFRKLSSGHQVVLLTITSLVANVEERTLVLLDEPEGHLHPPLLAAFIRALSEVLTERNAFAIIATHSPVILQEVPSKCVHVIKRSGNATLLMRPNTETFGENVGVLTREAFGLEVDSSGFNRMITDAMLELGKDYDTIVTHFNGELGGEARLILSALATTEDEAPELEF